MSLNLCPRGPGGDVSCPGSSEGGLLGAPIPPLGGGCSVDFRVLLPVTDGGSSFWASWDLLFWPLDAPVSDTCATGDAEVLSLDRA